VNNIVLIGMPGSGKSTVGVLLAKALGYNFLDVDLVIQQREGQLLQNILDTYGMDHFLQVEEAAVQSIRCERTVIAPGGSAVCTPGGLAHLKALGPVVYLRVPVDELQKRITNLSTRGIVMRPGQTLSDVMAVRAPLYEGCADLIVDVRPGDELAFTMLEVMHRLQQSGSNVTAPQPQG